MPGAGQNGYNTLTVEEMVLRLFQGQGYTISRPAGAVGGSLTLLHLAEGRALLRFLWGQREWEEEQVRQFGLQMEGLKATHGYLVTNGHFSPAAREAAERLAVTLTDGPELQEIIFRTAPLLQGIGSRSEPPLPFNKYIPWFVGISLVLIAAVVLILISIALSLAPAE